MADRKCAHQGCNCAGDAVRADGFCSDACKKGQMQSGRCACGDSACKK